MENSLLPSHNWAVWQQALLRPDFFARVERDRQFYGEIGRKAGALVAARRAGILLAADDRLERAGKGGLQEISRELNRLNIGKPQSKQWHVSTVRSQLAQ